jgi:hypothetical protein
VAARVREELDSPLFLLSRDGQGRRRSIMAPGFSDLVRASLRSVGLLWRAHAQALDADFAGIKAAAADVRLIENGYQRFQQRKWSNRTEQRFELDGATGYGVYGPVPMALLPWLIWGGRVRVGSHRVAGAGGWEVLVSC